MITTDVNDGDTMIKRLFIYLVSIFNVMIIASDEKTDKKLDTHIVFQETSVKYHYNPYNKLDGWEGEPKRFYALIHETIFEHTKKNPEINFIALSSIDESKSANPSFKDKNQIDNQSYNSLYIIKMPKDHQVAEQWKFSDGSKIKAIDLKISLQYAICYGLIRNDFIGFDDIKVIDNDLYIYSPRNMTRETFTKSIKDIYILPSNCFGDFVSDGCDCDENGTDHGIRCDDYDKEHQCVENWTNIKSISKNGITTSGPFKISNIEKNTRIELDWTYQVKHREKNLDGITIMKNSIRNLHVNNYPEKVNLLIDIPPSTISSDVFQYTQALTIPTYNANLLWINYRGKNSYHLKKINFRKAIRLAINKEKIIKTVFSYNGNTLSGPYSTNTPFYNNNVNEERKSHKKNIEKAKKLLEEIGYNYDKKSRILYDDRGYPVELRLMYDDSEITSIEKTAIKTSIFKDLESIGIKMIEKSITQGIGNSFETAKKIHIDKWDLAYDEILIRDAIEVYRYYHSDDRYGIKNYGGFNLKDFESLINSIQTTTDESKKGEFGQDIHKLLSDNVASIYLWSLKTHSYFDFTKIDAKSVREDNQYFFVEPHKWKMVEGK